jgi:hypothetical protein
MTAQQLRTALEFELNEGRIQPTIFATRYNVSNGRVYRMLDELCREGKAEQRGSYFCFAPNGDAVMHHFYNKTIGQPKRSAANDRSSALDLRNSDLAIDCIVGLDPWEEVM